MASSSDQQSRKANKSAVSGEMKLIIKAANQKYEDYVIENFELDWSVKYLKEYLGQNYPKKSGNFLH